MTYTLWKDTSKADRKGWLDLMFRHSKISLKDKIILTTKHMRYFNMYCRYIFSGF